MRKFIFTRTKTFFLLMGISFYCHAQIAKANLDSTESEGKFKKIRLYRNEINSNALRHFMKRYKDVSNEKWTVTDAGISASFVDNEIRHSICYDNNGTWLFTIRAYLEKHLPKSIKKLVRRKYSSYHINGVEETQKPFNQLAYVVLLEDETKWIKLRVEGGSVSEFERVIK